jgi:GT2 family glycosyltransferase
MSDYFGGSIDVSVVVPFRSFDDVDFAECLGSLHALDFDGCFEVIFVEGGSIGQARNVGINHARGRFIAFIDSDCRSPSDWLSKMVGYLNCFDDAGGVGGGGVSLGVDWFSRVVDVVYGSYLGSLSSASLSRSGEVKLVSAVSTHNSIFRDFVVDEVGGFDERFLMNEDTDLSYRVRELGYSLFFVPDSVVFHRRKGSFWKLGLKFFRYGVSRTRAFLTNWRFLDIRIFGLLLLFLVGLGLLLFGSLLGVVMLGVYLGLGFLSGVFYSVRLRSLLFLLCPVFYMVQHLGYALGLLWGFTRGKYSLFSYDSTFNIHYELIDSGKVTQVKDFTFDK